mmetsp:Transcript_16680/g.30371  ORF Transcript_16680/g.30371 Transcript_16680/m.30371 type:complete len:146 (+) Transcript_16680:48-485(+)
MDIKIYLLISMTAKVVLIGGGFLAWILYQKRQQARNAADPTPVDIEELTVVAGLEKGSKTIVPVSEELIKSEFAVVVPPPGTQCVVCLTGMEEGKAECIRLQCSHILHSECILQWWAHKPRTALECPLCKQKQTLTGDALAVTDI